MLTKEEGTHGEVLIGLELVDQDFSHLDNPFRGIKSQPLWFIA